MHSLVSPRACSGGSITEGAQSGPARTLRAGPDQLSHEL